MIVVDASAALAGLLNDGPARSLLAGEALHAPHLIDSEVANALRRRVAAGQVDEPDAIQSLGVWRHLGLTRYGVASLLDRIWDLRHNLSAYDAGYVALAEALGCALVTADVRLANAAGLRCPVTVVPR